MKQSQLFTKITKESPKDEVSKNAQLLIRAGFVTKEMAGVYSYLPLGLRVLNKIVQIIREEMNAIGGQEIHLTALQDKTLWEKTDRWSDKIVDNWFKTSLKDGREVGLAFTHEEPLTQLMKAHIHSYKDLPRAAYQFQTKFRNELRAKSGIMRGREFLMKDLYSFSKNQEEHDTFYNAAKEAYIRIFNKLGIGDKTYVTFASGGVFSKFSHEFQTISEAGEDLIYISAEKGIAINKEVLTDEVLADLGVERATLIEQKSIEVGNIFSLGTKFSEPIELVFTDEDGTNRPVIMGSYGIGPGRVMGTIVELLSDENGIVWPEAVAPYRVHLVSLCREENEIHEADNLYSRLLEQNIEVLYDDRTDIRPGQKFAESDLIGIPHRLVISPKTIEQGGIEYKKRTEASASMKSLDDILKEIA